MTKERIVDPVSFAPSQVTIGKYNLLMEIGHGGMGDVYLACGSGPARFKKLVVVKRLRPALANEPGAIDMFLDEARLAARLNHPNIVQTYEVGHDERNHYMVMEYLEGQSLHSILRRHAAAPDARGDGFPPLDMGLAILCRTLAGLHAAHTLRDFEGNSLHVVHRDVSPHNIYVTYDGHVKLLDFGIAKTNDRSYTTRTGVIKGKVTYISPEQVAGAAVDHRSDIFSVGIILYGLAARRRIWGDKSETGILQCLIAQDIPRSPRDHNPDVDPELDAICVRALDPNPAGRYPSARAMQEDLEAYLTRRHGCPDSDEVGAYVTRLFEDERQTLRSTVDRLLRGDDSCSPPSSAPPAPSSIPSHSGPPGDSPVSATAPSPDLARLARDETTPSFELPSPLLSGEAEGNTLPSPGVPVSPAPTSPQNEVTGSVRASSVPPAPVPVANAKPHRPMSLVLALGLAAAGILAFLGHTLVMAGDRAGAAGSLRVEDADGSRGRLSGERRGRPESRGSMSEGSSPRAQISNAEGASGTKGLRRSEGTGGAADQEPSPQPGAGLAKPTGTRAPTPAKGSDIFEENPYR